MKKVSKQQRAMETVKDKPAMTVGLDLGAVTATIAC